MVNRETKSAKVNPYHDCQVFYRVLEQEEPDQRRYLGLIFLKFGSLPLLFDSEAQTLVNNNKGYSAVLPQLNKDICISKAESSITYLEQDLTSMSNSDKKLEVPNPTNYLPIRDFSNNNIS